MEGLSAAGPEKPVLYACRAEGVRGRIRNAVRDLESEQPGITFEQCVEILGTPEEAAREYLKGFPAQHVAEHIRWQAMYQKLLLGGLMILLAVTAGLWLYIRWFVWNPLAG